MTDWFSQLADVVTAHADQALFFCLMTVSGFNLPIPEDLMILPLRVSVVLSPR